VAETNLTKPKITCFEKENLLAQVFSEQQEIPYFGRDWSRDKRQRNRKK